MRILQVNHGFPPEGTGGSERYVQAIARGLSDRGHHLRAFVGSIEVRGEPGLTVGRDGAIEVVRVHRGDLFFDRWDKAYHPEVDGYYRNYVAGSRPDVVHVHQWIRLTSNLCAINSELGIPSVVTLHEFHTTCPRLFRTKRDGSACEDPIALHNCGACADRWPFQGDAVFAGELSGYDAAFRHELRCARRILAPSRTHAAALARHLQCDPGRIEALPLARHSPLAPAPRHRGERLRFVFFSSLYPHKGIGLLIDAFLRMRHRQAVELHVFGDEVLPEFTAELRARVAGLPVTFHGGYRPEDLVRFPMDLVVLPTLVPETWSFILDEASDLRVPILAADAGAIPERATAAVELFRRGDAGALRDAMDRLATEPRRLEAMRAATPVRTFPMAEHLDALESVYREAVDAGPNPVDPAFRPAFDPEQWAAREERLRSLAGVPGAGDGPA